MFSFSEEMFTVKQQIDYGLRNGYDTLILAILKEDNTKGEYVSSMDLERALEFLKTKVKTMIIQQLYNLLFQVSSLVAQDRSAWLKGTEENYPPLPMPPSKLFNNPVAVKSHANKQLRSRW